MALHRAFAHFRAGHWPEETADDAVTLDFDARHRRRTRIMTDRGEDILIDLPKAIAMSDGDGLQLENGMLLRVRAAAESVVAISHVDFGQLMRLAWHLGNRHLPTDIRANVLHIRPDHVIEEMLLGFGATLVRTQAGFQPEGGAYGDHRHDRSDHERHHHA